MAAACCRGAVAVTMAAWVIPAREEATTELDLGLAQRDVPTTCWVTFVWRGDASLGPPPSPASKDKDMRGGERPRMHAPGATLSGNVVVRKAVEA